MYDVFQQYAGLIDIRTRKVREQTPAIQNPDMRIGWLLWEDYLTEFLYFEQRLEAPNPDDYYAEWNVTPPKGVRKGSKSLWIYERSTNKKRYSITTSAGIKIQPYFDVPAPSDKSLYYFRVQSEPLDYDTVRAIQHIIGELDKEAVSEAIIKSAKNRVVKEVAIADNADLAKPIPITRKAFEVFQSTWEGVSDEHRAQLFLESLHGAR